MQNTRKVLYLDDIPTSYRLGVHKLISREPSIDYHVLFCADSEPGRVWDLDFEGLNYTMLPGYQYRPEGQINPFSYKLNLGVVKALKAHRPDVVVLSGYAHPTMWLAARWCRRNQIPYGLTCETSEDNQSSSGLKRKFRDYIIRPIVENMSFCLPVSRAAGAYLKRAAGKDLPSYLFPNTPDVSVFSVSDGQVDRESCLGEAGVEVKSRHILFVGRLIDAKRPLDLIDAFELLPKSCRDNTSLVFVGDGPLFDPVEKAAATNKDIYALGWIKDQKALAGLMQACDVFVLPSFHEPWGAVVNEAMAAGCTVIASDRVGAAQDLIEDGRNGYVYPMGDIQGLSEKLAHVLTSDQADIQVAAVDTAHQYGHQFAADNLLEAVFNV